MSGRRDTSRRPPYWLLAALPGLMLSSPGLALGLLAGAAILGRLIPAVRAGLARRRHRAVLRRHPGAIPLGIERHGGLVALSEAELAAHGLILGASGAGKSTTLLAILTERIRSGHPVIAIDLKGSPAFAQELGRAAEAAGRPFRQWTPHGGCHWNPLQHGTPTQLKDKLICTERFSEPHYQRAAERYLQLALGVLGDLHPERAPTLEEVVQAMEPRRLSHLARHLPPERAGRLNAYLATLSPDQLSGVRGLATRLAIISESDTGRYLAAAPQGAATLDLRRALAGEEVALFSLNSSTYGRLAAQLGSLAVQDLVTAVGDRLERSGADAAAMAQALVGIDEFSALGADNVIALLARGREAGASVLLATQELADLDRAAPGLRDQVLGVTAIKIAHRQDVPASAQTIAQMAGTVPAWDVSEPVGLPWRGISAGRLGTRRQVEEFRVHPNEIKSLRTGEAVVISKTPRSSVHTVHVVPPRREPGRER